MRLSSSSHRHWCTSCARHHEYACNKPDCDQPVNAPCARAEMLNARKKLVATVALISMLAGGCAQRKHVHVPRVRYQATFNDKDCKRGAKPESFDCKHVHLEPLTIDAKGQQ